MGILLLEHAALLMVKLPVYVPTANEPEIGMFKTPPEKGAFTISVMPLAKSIEKVVGEPPVAE